MLSVCKFCIKILHIWCRTALNSTLKMFNANTAVIKCCSFQNSIQFDSYRYANSIPSTNLSFQDFNNCFTHEKFTLKVGALDLHPVVCFSLLTITSQPKSTLTDPDQSGPANLGFLELQIFVISGDIL